MIKTPVRGMRDLTPNKMLLRDFVLGIIEREAVTAGYQKIETPALEHIENLTSGKGGENESLIFKILKRGEALTAAQTNNDSLVDSGLRYDLTVPLARFFAANQKELALPFKSLQIGPVWRADRPQKGRFRQFIQCDMDVIGDSSVLAEIDTITTVSQILQQILSRAGISDLTIRINDRRLLLASAKLAGFAESDYAQVLISLDKADKIGLDGVAEDLANAGLASDNIKRFLELFSNTQISLSDFVKKIDTNTIEQTVLGNLETIISAVTSSGIKIVFDPSLVRGMGYYTGPIFECSAGGFGSSVAGGGRYDKMIGQITGGGDIPACGFSIGFERLVTLLEDRGFTPDKAIVKRAILIDKEASSAQIEQAFAEARTKRQAGEIVSVMTMNKNLKYQIDVLLQVGFSEFDKIWAKRD